MEQTYFRRGADQRGWLRRKERYEVWQPDAPPVAVTLAELDRRLDGRRYPADFWAAVDAADQAHAVGDDAWFDRVGVRVSEPPRASADEG